MTKILPVIVGFDTADYAFARIFHENCGVDSVVISEIERGSINNSSILTKHIVPKGTIVDDAKLLGVLDDVAQAHPSRRPILLLNSDEGVEFAARYRERLEPRWFLPYASTESVATANSKDAFARVCEELGLLVPRRHVLDLTAPQEWETALEELSFPIIAKPLVGSQLDIYWRRGLRKVIELTTKDSAMEFFTSLASNGVDIELMLQDLIPGDDTTQWVVNGYIDGRGEVTAAATGRVLLGLHQPRYLGNAAMILVMKNHELIDSAIQVVKRVGLRGFFSLDVKIDPRDGEPRWLDLNPRIGRSHYYLKVGGIDLAQAMINDMEGREGEYQTNTTEGIYTVIPSCFISRRYVRDRELYIRAHQAMKKRIIHPLQYPADRNIKRTFYRIESEVNQARQMLKWYPRPTESGF
ncbi:ATP-grasp domain-containing protein [Arcanobacterium haemolyticum]|nr:ATP-grasp domain-containing protein [Arcanobacterium haemolyticum]